MVMRLVGVWKRWICAYTLGSLRLMRIASTCARGRQGEEFSNRTRQQGAVRDASGGAPLQHLLVNLRAQQRVRKVRLGQQAFHGGCQQPKSHLL